MELINLALELRIVCDFHETRGPGTEKLEEKQARAALCSSFSLVHEIVTISGQMAKLNLFKDKDRLLVEKMKRRSTSRPGINIKIYKLLHFKNQKKVEHLVIIAFTKNQDILGPDVLHLRQPRMEDRTVIMVIVFPWWIQQQ